MRPLPKTNAPWAGTHEASILHRGALPLGLPDSVARSPLRRLAPLRWLVRCAHSRRGSARVRRLERELEPEPHLQWVLPVARHHEPWVDLFAAAGGDLID